jgi:hypothetical protein
MRRIEMSSLTPEQTRRFQQSIAPEIAEAENHARTNQWYDTMFKIIILCIGVGIVITSGIAAAELYPNFTKWLSATSAILGGLLTAVSAFAYEQFNFAKRQSTYATKASALKSLRDELILQPDARTFFTRYDQIRSWNDNNPPTQLTPSQPATTP